MSGVLLRAAKSSNKGLGALGLGGGSWEVPPAWGPGWVHFPRWVGVDGAAGSWGRVAGKVGVKAWLAMAR